MNNTMSQRLQMLREGAPLIHAITNPISINQCANAVLALGARPIMAEHPEEVCQITRTAAALLLNLGNITEVRMQSMAIAARTAGKEGIPFTLDAVGVACSDLRRTYVHQLMEKVPPTVLKGNYAEIQALACPSYTASGVDGDRQLSLATVAAAAEELSQRYGAVILASGETDLVCDGRQRMLIRNGTPQLGSVTGTGCMLGALCSCFLAVCPPLDAAVSACVMLGVAGERAATDRGSGTFQQNLMDQLSTLKGETIQVYERTEEYHFESHGYHTLFGD